MSSSLPPHGLQHVGFPVHNQLPGLTQTHIHRVSDAIQPSHPLWSPSPPPPAFSLSQHQGHFKWVSSLHKFQFSRSGYLTLWDPMDCSMPCFPVHHQFLELAQTHCNESVMPSNCLILCRPLLLPSFYPSIRVFSKKVSSSHQVAKVLEFQLQDQSFQWIFRTDFL